MNALLAHIVREFSSFSYGAGTLIAGEIPHR